MRGFTLLELMVVVAIIALGTAGVALVLRDGTQSRLDQEGQRLAAQLEAARAQSRASGRPVRWVPLDGGFRFSGLSEGAAVRAWLFPETRVRLSAGSTGLVLGPEPLIGPQAVELLAENRRVRVATDGVRPFGVLDGAAAP